MKFDLAIIGGGGAGFAAAAKANELGVKAALINKGLPTGGTCVNVGCVPSKFLLEASFEKRSSLNFQSLIREKNEVVLRNREEKYKNVLQTYKNIKYFEEFARFEGPNKLRIGSEILEAKKVLICPGSSNRLFNPPGIDELEKNDLLDNISAFELKEVPKSMIVIGGGYTGVEVAQMFANFGCKITQIESKGRILSHMEPEISKTAQVLLKESGVDVITNAQVKRLRKRQGKVVVTTQIDGMEKEFYAEKLFIAIGVQGNTNNLNLAAIGLETNNKGFITVDQKMRTKVEAVFAAGDVTGSPLLETVAAREGAIAVETAFNAGDMSLNYDIVPTAVFTRPQIASVGTTEKELMEKINICECRTVELKFVPKADILSQTLGVSKMVINPKNKKITGYHLISPHAAEIIHEAAMAIRFGATIEDIIEMVHVFPTFSEVVKLTAQAFKRDIKVMSCCVE